MQSPSLNCPFHTASIENFVMGKGSGPHLHLAPHQICPLGQAILGRVEYIVCHYKRRERARKFFILNVDTPFDFS